ncbi:TorF family putative porin [Reyranella sp. CPCC 100927]|uniref:TorF family putative porin n=1 Tax=Reyranella sp. CPCC 100927 TaxID=2599616 RepID=UPI0011B7337F|nr:TorF family putative porin [Reyranella sp. CPCC 100927]TWT02615.1 hypothetical protein FQU96_30360 [Reyranella sp. CPCC 100927]
MVIKRLSAALVMAALWGGAAVAQTAPAPAPASTPAPEPPTPDPTGPFGGNITGIVTLTSDYRFRGISQSKKAPALQAGLTYEVPLSFVSFAPVSVYGGFWGSSINFSPDVDESLEIDMVAGVKFKFLNEKMVLDLGWIGYRYPGSIKGAHLHYDEFGGALSYDFGFASIAGQVRYSPNFFARSGSAWYKQAMVTVPLSFIQIHDKVSFKIFGGLGHQSIQHNARFANPDYWDWQVGIVATVYGVDLGLTYVDTNISKTRCNGGGYKYCAPRAIFSISKSF